MPTAGRPVEAAELHDRPDASSREGRSGAEREEGEPKKSNSLLKALADAHWQQLSPVTSRAGDRAALHGGHRRLPPRTTRPVKVTKDATVRLPFGPPYKPVVKVGYRQAEGKVQLQMSLVGSAGEICDDMQVNGRRPGTPEFTITDPKGKVVESGSFEYG